MTTKANFTFRGSLAKRADRATGPLSWLRKVNAIWAERQVLGRLDDHMLKDIGRSRDQVEAEAGRAAWDAPERWLR